MKKPGDRTGDRYAAEALRSELSRYLAKDRIEHFGRVRESWTQYVEEYFWDESMQDFRIADLANRGFLPGNCDILDLAAGCGQFLFRALEKGYNCYGVEPETWKRDFIQKKNLLLKRPAGWEERVVPAAGEKLPFPDDRFDCVTSFQTLEHVKDPAQVLAEMVRVTRQGGGIFLRCPDYRSTFEAHYRLPWLPLFPRRLAKGYLRLLDRPQSGLDTLQYVTLPRIRRWIRTAARGGEFMVIDEDRRAFVDALQRRGVAWGDAFYPFYRALSAIRFLGRREMSVNLFIRLVRK